MSLCELTTEKIAYSPSGRYGCRPGVKDGDLGEYYEMLINDFQTDNMHCVKLMANYCGRIVHYYWTDDDYLAVILKKSGNFTYKIVDGKIEYVDVYECNRECRMIFKIDLDNSSKEFKPVAKKIMKAYRESGWVKPCFITDQFVTVNGKEYFIMFYEPWIHQNALVTNEYEPCVVVSEEEDEAKNEPRKATEQEIRNAEEKEQKKKKEDSGGEAENKERQVFIPKMFEDEDVLPDVHFDMEEIFNDLGLAVRCDDDKEDDQPVFNHGLNADGPYFYMRTHHANILRMNMHYYFNAVMGVELKPKTTDYCSVMVLPVPEYQQGCGPFIISNGYAYVVGTKKSRFPLLTVEGWSKVYGSIKEAIWMKRVFKQLPVNWTFANFSYVGDEYVNVVDLQKNECVGMFKMENKKDAYNGNLLTIHPSGEFISMKGHVIDVTPPNIIKTSKKHFALHIRLEVVKNKTGRKTENQFRPIDKEKIPNFIVEGKKKLNMIWHVYE